jgi:hypothetical protein
MIAAAMILALQGADDLKIRSISLSETKIGRARREMKAHPFEQAVVRFEIEGLRTDEKGERKLAFSYTLLDADGRTLLDPIKGDTEGIDFLPPSSGWVYCYFRLNNPETKGPVRVVVEATDGVSGKSLKAEAKVEVLPADPAIVYARFVSDAAGQVPRCPVFCMGESAALHYDVVSLTLKDNSVAFEQDVEIVDAATGERLFLKEKFFDFKSDKPMAIVNARFSIPCSRPGLFLARLKARDMNAGGKLIERAIPFEVRAP